MRSVICHFFNEAYLLPWWLKHHVPLFDYGVMIDHGSSDNSVELIRLHAPHWRIVHTRLVDFNAFLNDLEVMRFEQELPGWKIALNATEFLVSVNSLRKVEEWCEQNNLDGFACSGFVAVDLEPDILPTHDQSLLVQKPWAIDDNKTLERVDRINRGLTDTPERNRFYHRDQVGMHFPGRHRSHHPASRRRRPDVMVIHFGYSPWNDSALARKIQIQQRLNSKDLARGWGIQHLRGEKEWNAEYEKVKPLAEDLRNHPLASRSNVFGAV